MSDYPSGEERIVRRSGVIAIDGAPITTIIALAAVIAVLAFVPLSVVIGTGGKSFPMSQAVYPLVGWLLGPIAGGIADAIGATVGVILAPHTSTMPIATILGALAGGLAAGSMRPKGASRQRWGIVLSIIFAFFYALYAGWAILHNGADLYPVLFGSLINWTGLLFYALPTRTMLARWIASENLLQAAAGLFYGTWVVAGLSHLVSGTLVYLNLNWGNEVWLIFAPAAPLEHLTRCLVGTVVGTGVIAGLRAIHLPKAEHAVY